MATASEWFSRQMPKVRERDGRAHESRRAFAERLGRVGVDLSAKALARIETGPDPSGRTRGVTLDEALALAYALNTAPVHLLTPRDDGARVQITPTVEASARDVRAWIRGERPLPGVDEIAYRQEVPASEVQYRTQTTVIRELADAIDAVSGDQERCRYLAGLLVAVVRVLWDPPEIEWRTGETETKLMREIHRWEQP